MTYSSEFRGYPREDTQSASQSLTPESLPLWIPMLTVNVLGVMQERTLSLSAIIYYEHRTTC
jgi:hypothetical protein